MFFHSPKFGPVALAHNGHITNAHILRKSFEEQGSVFKTTSDSEIFLHLIAKSSKPTLEARIAEIPEYVRGAYSLVVMTRDSSYAFRDPFGFRPLVCGKKNNSFVFASESCALDLIGAKYISEIPSACVVKADIYSNLSGINEPHKEKEKNFCAFEPIYFSRPDSKMHTDSIYTFRKAMGAMLAKESHVPADIVVPVPDSGVPAASGYAQYSKTSLELGLVRNHYVGRTFIEPSQEIRDFGVKLKLNPIRDIIAGKRIIVVDDSLVRGTTCKKIIRMLWEAGAKEIHFRISSPPLNTLAFMELQHLTNPNL